VHALNAYQSRRLELDGRLFLRAHALFGKALEGGRHLTRAELADELAKARILARGQRLAYIVAHAELEGLICSGALRGKQHTYALLEERAPGGGILDREEALAELTRRFFVSHGPATLKHFAWWSGLTIADGKAGLAMARQHLTRIEAGGRTYWIGPAGIAREADARQGLSDPGIRRGAGRVQGTRRGRPAAHPARLEGRLVSSDPDRGEAGGDVATNDLG
jgi:hypothetical protein